MILNFSIDMPEGAMILALRKRGIIITSHDFGHYGTEHHNRPVWRPDHKPAALIDGTPTPIAEAFSHVFAYEIKLSLLKAMNQLTY